MKIIVVIEYPNNTQHRLTVDEIDLPTFRNFLLVIDGSVHVKHWRIEGYANPCALDGSLAVKERGEICFDTTFYAVPWSKHREVILGQENELS